MRPSVWTWNKIPANLLSLGALDFGMVVEGAVVTVENIVRYLGRNNGDGKPPITSIREAAHEVQTPVFYSIGIIITAYLPIFTLKAVEGRLFKPRAWTVSFALLGALIFSMLVAPLLCSLILSKEFREWHNPVMTSLSKGHLSLLRYAIHFRWVTAGIAAFVFAASMWIMMSGIIGSEFLLHLDEGAVWARATLAPALALKPALPLWIARASSWLRFPRSGKLSHRWDDPMTERTLRGFNTEYFIDLKPKENWRPVFRQNNEELIAATANSKRSPGRFGISRSLSPTTWKRRSAALRGSSPSRSTVTI